LTKPPSLPRPGVALVRWCRAVSQPMPAGRVRGGCDSGPGTRRSPGAGRGGARPPAGGGTRSGRPAPPTPGQPGHRRGTGGRHLRFHRHGQVGPSPRHRRAAGPAAIMRGWPVRAGPIRHRLMSGCAVTGAGLSGARFPWLPRGPGSDGLAQGIPRAADMAWPSGSLGGQYAPAAAVSPHRPSEPGPDFFESWRSSWSPVTESNRRPSPYYGEINRSRWPVGAALPDHR
jgi:hypothetical protein